MTKKVIRLGEFGFYEGEADNDWTPGVKQDAGQESDSGSSGSGYVWVIIAGGRSTTLVAIGLGKLLA